jgi:putative glutamine amidotransferase
VPLLAICRGAQLVNVALGGTLMQHLPTVSELDHRDPVRFDQIIHEVEVAKGTVLRKVVGARSVGVNSLHHQAIGALGTGVRPTGWAPDGVVEAIEVVGRPTVIGVQWHPELLLHQKAQRKLFRWLVKLAASAAMERASHPERRPLSDSVA